MVKEFKDKMKDFKDERNKKWGNLANKWSIVAKNTVSSGVFSVIKEKF